MKTAIELITEERARQIAKGFDAAHDAEHTMGEIIEAAQCYACVASAQTRGGNAEEWPVEMFDGFHDSLLQWPFEDEAYRPEEHAINNLVKAAALLTAEIERLQNVKSRSFTT